ncbi:YopX family protein, partial [Enterobacter hormaechei]
DYAQFCFKNDASNFLSYYRNLCIIGNIHENPELLEVAE